MKHFHCLKHAVSSFNLQHCNVKILISHLLYPFLNFRSGASLLSTTDSVSPVQRRWPEDIAWHPLGNSLFSAYTADSGDAQISVLNLNKTQGVWIMVEIYFLNKYASAI
jgi:hypothetical protein